MSRRQTHKRQSHPRIWRILHVVSVLSTKMPMSNHSQTAKMSSVAGEPTATTVMISRLALPSSVFAVQVFCELWSYSCHVCSAGRLLATPSPVLDTVLLNLADGG